MSDDVHEYWAMFRTEAQKGRYLRCVLPMCYSEASSMYEVQVCQKHILLIWSLVQADLARQGKDSFQEH